MDPGPHDIVCQPRPGTLAASAPARIVRPAPAGTRVSQATAATYEICCSSSQSRSLPLQAARNETALDHYQARKHIAWYRHVTLALTAGAWLAVTAARAGLPGPAGDAGPGTSYRARDGAPGLWTTIRPEPVLQ